MLPRPLQHDIVRLREGSSLLVVQNAANVIPIRMRDDDGANVAGINAQRLEPRAKLAVGASKSSIDKDILIRRVDQENVVVNEYPVRLQVEFKSEPLKLRIFRVDHKLTCRMGTRSIMDDRAPKVAERELMGCDRHFSSCIYEALSPWIPPASGFS